MSETPIFVGIDVAKAQLDIALRPVQHQRLARGRGPPGARSAFLRT